MPSVEFRGCPPGTSKVSRLETQGTQGTAQTRRDAQTVLRFFASRYGVTEYYGSGLLRAWSQDRHGVPMEDDSCLARVLLPIGSRGIVY